MSVTKIFKLDSQSKKSPKCLGNKDGPILENPATQEDGFFSVCQNVCQSVNLFRETSLLGQSKPSGKTEKKGCSAISSNVIPVKVKLSKVPLNLLPTSQIAEMSKRSKIQIPNWSNTQQANSKKTRQRQNC